MHRIKLTTAGRALCIAAVAGAASAATYSVHSWFSAMAPAASNANRPQGGEDYEARFTEYFNELVPAIQELASSSQEVPPLQLDADAPLEDRIDEARYVVDGVAREVTSTWSQDELRQLATKLAERGANDANAVRTLLPFVGMDFSEAAGPHFSVDWITLREASDIEKRLYERLYEAGEYISVAQLTSERGGTRAMWETGGPEAFEEPYRQLLLLRLERLSREASENGALSPSPIQPDRVPVRQPIGDGVDP